MPEFTTERFILRGRKVQQALYDRIEELFAGKDQPDLLLDIIIKEHKTDRSIAQNRLAFMWYKERGEQIGESSAEQRNYCKLIYGCPLLIADDEDFAEFFDKVIAPLDYESQLKAMEWVPITRFFGVKTFSIYLNNIEVESRQQGIILSNPADFYYEAMGR